MTLAVLFLLVCATHSPAAEAVVPAKFDFSKNISPLIKTYCVTCHNTAKHKGDFVMEFADETQVRQLLLKDRAHWELVADRLRKKEMPPAKSQQPTPDERERLLSWVTVDVLAVNCDSQRDPGRVTLRRLNKAEYNNTIRDLLYIDNFKPADDFPADDSGYGFDNNGDVLSLSPLLVEQYLKAAEKSLDLAFKNKEAKAKLLECVKTMKETFYNHQERARTVVETFVNRAFRRPATKEEIDKLMVFVRMSLAQDGESSDRAAFLAMRAALVSPNFLYHVELDHAEESASLIAPLNEFELASRLSYFLWSSMPDPELYDLAKQNKLRENLEPQIHRMLLDRKAHALTENFAGQWLELRGLKQHAPNTSLYPDFDESLRSAMIEETEQFFDSIAKNDRSIMDFIDADYTFVNEKLAKFYGIEGVTGDDFREVKLTGGQRGGVLTQASILTLTSTPTRTSPVKRGKWILDNILNAPPPPPPADVPPLEDDGKQITGTLRQRLEKHRADANCAVCHDRIDPLGLAFENFNAIGAWRVRDGTADIDPAGKLATGESFDGPKQLRSILKGREADFRRCLAEKMSIYALGRGLESPDKCAIDDICAAVAKDQNRFSSLVLAIVRSEPFQYRKSAGSIKQ